MALLGVNEVWELDRILNKEDWRVIANHIVIAFFRVELNRKATRVTVAVVGATLTGDR